MIQFTFLFIFFIFHILFFINYFVFGTEYAEFFGFRTSYMYDSDIAIKTFIFTLISFISIFLGLYSNKFLKFKAKVNKLWRNTYSTLSLKSLVILITGITFFVSLNFFLDLSGYSQIAATRSVSTFKGAIYDLRYFTLIYISYNLLNYKISDLIKARPRTYTIILSIIYIFSSLLLQTRSIMFEIFFIVVYSYLLWNKNKIKLQYILILYIFSIIPNLLLLFRVDLYNLNFRDILSSLFQYEYSFTLANFISTNVANDKLLIFSDGFTFLSKLSILIPSVFRNLLDIQVNQSFYYEYVSELAGVFGGGFSFLGELYANFGEFTYLILFILGVLITRMISINSANLGSSTLISATYPLVICQSILTFRNDIFPFIKTSIYLIAIACVMKIFSQIKLIKNQ